VTGHIDKLNQSSRPPIALSFLELKVIDLNK